MTGGWRLGALGLVFAVLFGVLGLRLWTIQVTETESYTEQALQNQVRIVRTPAPRGDIFDRHGNLLAGSRPALAAVVDLALIEEEQQEALARHLGAFLDLPASEVLTTLEEAPPGSLLTIAEDITELQALTLVEHREDFPGVAVIPQPLRDYPEGDLAAQVLGYIGQPNEDDLLREGVKGTSVVGKAGVERVYDDLLRGTEGQIKYRVDARRNVLAREGEADPEAGGNLFLTIDADVQRRLQDSLAEGLAVARDQEMADRAAALRSKDIKQRLEEALLAAIAERDESTATAAENNAGAIETADLEPIEIDEGAVLGPLYEGLPLDINGVCDPVQRVDVEVDTTAFLSGTVNRPISIDRLQIPTSEDAGPLVVITVGNATHEVGIGDSFATTLKVIDITDHSVVLYHQDPYCPVRAVGVVLDPNNGDVIAMASHPTFEPNAFVDGLSLTEWYELGTVSAFTNFAVQGLYAPASTLKSIAYTMAIEEAVYPYDRPVEERTVSTGDEEPVVLEPLLTDADAYYCREQLRFPLGDGSEEVKRDWKYPTPHGFLDLHGALQQSCDTYFWELAYRIHTERADPAGIANENLWQEWARSFGLDARTGVDLPFEAKGLVPDRQWMVAEEAAGSARVAEGRRWQGGDLMNAIIGEGAVLTTPLQLANAYAAMVNGGTVWRPRVVTEVRDQADELIDDNPIEPVNSVNLSARTTRLLRADLAAVVTVGTAQETFRRFGDNLDQIGGKTGTGEVIKASRNLSRVDRDAYEVDNGWFVGVAPISAPQYVVAVVVERGGSGGQVAAPIARQVLQYLVNGPDTVTPIEAGARTD